jgi:hypothetical protein
VRQELARDVEEMARRGFIEVVGVYWSPEKEFNVVEIVLN